MRSSSPAALVKTAYTCGPQSVPDLEELGIGLDADKNAAARGEATIHSDRSRIQLWVVPTNEEIVVARQTKALLESES